MSPLEVIKRVQEEGGVIENREGILKIKLPKGVRLTIDEQNTLSEYKSQLLSFFRTTSAVSVTETPKHPRNNGVSETTASENDPEREAIAWVDTLDQEQGEAALQTARRELQREFVSGPDGKPRWWSRDLSDLENEVLDQFMSYGPSGPDAEDLTDMTKTEVDELQPCPQCGSLWQWQSPVSDQWSCRTCSPPGVVTALTKYTHGIKSTKKPKSPLQLSIRGRRTPEPKPDGTKTRRQRQPAPIEVDDPQDLTLPLLEPLRVRKDRAGLSSVPLGRGPGAPPAEPPAPAYTPVQVSPPIASDPAGVPPGGDTGLDLFVEPSVNRAYHEQVENGGK